MDEGLRPLRAASSSSATFNDAGISADSWDIRATCLVWVLCELRPSAWPRTLAENVVARASRPSVFLQGPGRNPRGSIAVDLVRAGLPTGGTGKGLRACRGHTMLAPSVRRRGAGQSGHPCAALAPRAAARAALGVDPAIRHVRHSCNV